MDARKKSRGDRFREYHKRLLLRQGSLNEQCRPPQIFAVITWGAAASWWLTAVLNDCPSVFCVHAQNTVWNRFGNADHLSGLEYLRIVGMQGRAVDLAGDVHGVSRFDIPEIRDFFGDQFSAAVLVRDPLPRLRSMLALNLRRLTEGGALVDIGYIDAKFPDVVRMLPNGSPAERIFVHSANMLNAIVEEREIGPIFRMEDVVSKPKSLLQLVQVLSGGRLEAPQDWAKAAMSRRIINRHSSSQSTPPFGDWENRVLRAIVSADAISAYEQLGYDMAYFR